MTQSSKAGVSVRQIIDQRAQEAPDETFLIDPENGRTYSYTDLRAWAGKLAGFLTAHGAEPGDSVAYACENGPASAMTILGLFHGGFLATAVNLVSGNDVIAYVLEHSGAKIVLVQDGTRELVARACEGLDDPPALIQLSEVAAFSGSAVTGAEPSADDAGLLMYTSGTTGRPKGVVLTHRALVAGGANPALAHKLTAADRALCVLPLYHINGLCVTVMGPLVSGGSVIMPGKFSVRRFWPIAAEHGATWFSVVPTQISYLLHDEDSAFAGSGALRFGRSASAPLSPDVQRAFEERFGLPIIETMGLTETAAQILSNPLPPGTRKIGSPGIAFGNEVMIGDDRQHEVARGREGEVLVRGDNVMREYLKNPQATTEALTRDGWLRTGDLGRMDDEGYVFITGRLKELIIKGGENIAPREVDEALYSHPEVIEAAAFGCPCKDYGERVEAGVVISQDAEVSEDELIGLCTSKLGRFKTPDRIHFLSELPKGPSGKIQRAKLKVLVTGA